MAAATVSVAQARSETQCVGNKPDVPRPDLGMRS